MARLRNRMTSLAALGGKVSLNYNTLSKMVVCSLLSAAAPCYRSMAASFGVSGKAGGEEKLIGRPAILDMPVGHGHVIAFNFNPLHRDMNRGDHRLVWNAIINWEAILRAQP